MFVHFKNLFIFDQNRENLYIFSLKKKVITFLRVFIRGKSGNPEGKWGKFLVKMELNWCFRSNLP